MDEDKLRWLAAIIIVAIGLAYMGWLVLTFLEQRETGISIRQTLLDFTEQWQPPTVTKPTVDSEVVPE